MQTQSIPIDMLRRNFGEIKKKLPTTSFVLTDRGQPIGILQATPQVKKERMEQMFGSWKGTELDDDSLWEEARKKSSRKRIVSL